MIRLGSPEITEEDVAAVAAVLRSGFLVQGAQVREFETRFAACLAQAGQPPLQAVAVSSGTAALHLAVLALGIGPGDEVIVPDFTWPATANVVEAAGARAVPVDIDPTTYNLDGDALRRAVTPRTRAIIPVHLFGLSADMDVVLEVAHRFDLPVIEDAACALGAEYKGGKCGGLGTIGCFSFHPRKIITTGEGGMVVAADPRLADRVRMLRNHGLVSSDGKNRFHSAGLNYRMTDFQAALGLAQLGRLAAILARRRRLAELYQERLANCPGVQRPFCPAGLVHAWQAYVVTLEDRLDRDNLVQALRDAGVEATLGTYSVSAQPFYLDRTRPCPYAQRAYRQSLCLPMHGRLTEAEVGQVADVLARLIQSRM